MPLQSINPRQNSSYPTIFGNNCKIHALIDSMRSYNIPIETYTNHPVALAYATNILSNKSLFHNTDLHGTIECDGINKENLLTLGYPATGLWGIKYRHRDIDYIIVDINPDEAVLSALGYQRVSPAPSCS